MSKDRSQRDCLHASVGPIRQRGILHRNRLPRSRAVFEPAVQSCKMHVCLGHIRIELQGALQHAKDHKITMITITQRPSLLNSVDKILLIVNGTVALFGMRQDVLKALEARGINVNTGSFGHLLQ